MSGVERRRRFISAARGDPADTAILLDFDGTLSPTVTDPATARPTEGAFGLLDALARLNGTVAVVSGRPLSFLEPLLPDSVTISGQYGLELHRPGGDDRSRADPEIRRGVDRSVDLLRHDMPSGVLIEPKGLTVTVHWRNAPEAEPMVRERVGAVAAETGLEVHDAKASVELRPAVATDKGTVVTELAAGAGVVVYAGDDLGDLPAFRAVGALGRDGRIVLRVAVGGPELPDAVRTAVDHVVDSPSALVDLLAELLPQSV